MNLDNYEAKTAILRKARMEADAAFESAMMGLEARSTIRNGSVVAWSGPDAEEAAKLNAVHETALAKSREAWWASLTDEEKAELAESTAAWAYRD